MNTFWNAFHILFQTVLILSAVGFNILFYAQIKYQTKEINVTRFLQLSKTVLTVSALLVYAHLEVYVTNEGKAFKLICIFKDFLEQYAMGSFTGGLLAVAILRLRVVKCVGNTNVLISKQSALITLAGCTSLPVLKFIVSTIVSNKDQWHTDEHHTISFCSATFHSDAILIMSNLVDTIPVPLTFIIYIVICRYVNAESMKKSNSKYSKSIKLSSYVIISVIVFTWVPYMVVKNLIYHIADQHILTTLYIALTYNKITVLLFHPIAEGIMLEHQRMKIKNMFSKTFKRRKKSHHLKEIKTENQDIEALVLNQNEVISNNISPSTLHIHREASNCLSRHPSKAIDGQDETTGFPTEYSLEDDSVFLPCVFRKRNKSWDSSKSISKDGKKQTVMSSKTFKSRSLSQDQMNFSQLSHQHTNKVIHVISNFLSTSAESVFSLFKEDKTEVNKKVTAEWIAVANTQMETKTKRSNVTSSSSEKSRVSRLPSILSVSSEIKRFARHSYLSSSSSAACVEDCYYECDGDLDRLSILSEHF